MSNMFLIFEQVRPVPPEKNKFRIGECICTSDGIRTRLTNTSFATVEEARAWATEHEDRPATAAPAGS